MKKISDFQEFFKARRRFDRTEVAAKATAFFKDGTSMPCLVHDISENETKNGLGMRVELIGYKGSDPPNDYFIYFEQTGHLVQHKPTWQRKI